jgi:hypothetical protein
MLESLRKFWDKVSPFASALLAFALMFLAGCAVTDGFFGYNPIEPDGGLSQPAPSDFTGGILSKWLPWIGAALSAVRTFYVEARKKGMDKNFKAVVLGIKEAFDAANGAPVDKWALYNSIQAARELYADRKQFDRLVDDIKRAYDLEKEREAQEEDES